VLERNPKAKGVAVGDPTPSLGGGKGVIVSAAAHSRIIAVQMLRIKFGLRSPLGLHVNHNLLCQLIRGLRGKVPRSSWVSFFLLIAVRKRVFAALSGKADGRSPSP